MSVHKSDERRPTNPVFCKDCFFSKKKNWFSKELLCTHTFRKEENINYTTGRIEIKEKELKTCEDERTFSPIFLSDGKCGRIGRYFQPKDEKERKIFRVEKTLDGEAI